MSALSIADTPEYGLVRIVCNEADKAKAALDEAGYRARVTKVTAVAVPNRPGGLAELLETLDNADISVEHQDGNAIFALKVTDSAQAAEAVFAIERAGFQILEEGELD